MKSLFALAPAFAWVLLASSDALAQADSDLFTEDQALTSADLFAGCAGVFDALSAASRAINRPALADQYNDTGNGFRAVAMYLLSYERRLRTGKEIKLGEFLQYVESIGESKKTRIMALVETKGIESIQQDVEICTDLASAQSELLDIIRRELLLP